METPQPPILGELEKHAFKDILISKSVSDYDLAVSIGTHVGDNHLSKMTKVQVQMTDKALPKEIREQSLQYVVKKALKHEARRKYQNVRALFLRESYFYNMIVKVYNSLQTERRLPNNLRFHELAECAYTCCVRMDEFFIFNDLQLDGFSMFNRHEPLDYNHVELTLRTLGKFHALSFGLRFCKPDVFKDVVDNIRSDTLFPDERRAESEDVTMHIETFSRKYFDITIETIKNDGKTEFKNIEETVANVKYVQDNLLSILVESVKGSKTEPYSAVCHGDFWNNNLMYKRNEYGEPIDMKFVDFQVTRYAPPVLDFIFYLFCNTEKYLRDKHFDDFKNAYYSTLESQMIALRIDPTVLYPRVVFEAQLKKYAKFGFGLSHLALPFFIAKSGDVPNFDDFTDKVASSSSNEKQLEANVHREVVPGPAKYRGAIQVEVSRVNDITDANDIIEQHTVLTDITMPIYKRRMLGLALDMEKYGWWQNLRTPL